MNNNIIVITRPRKNNDPTSYTYEWGSEAIKMAKKYGYNVVDIQKDDVTYDNVTNALLKYKPRLYIHIGHGCTTSLQGQNECIVTRRFSVDELVNMNNFRQILQPLFYSSGCTHTCKLEKDICSPICSHETNVSILKGTIVYTIACYSASQLGKCAVNYNVSSYIGYSDLMLFPVDELKSQDIFKDVHLVFLRELLEGKSVYEAEKKMNQYEDTLIKFHKKTKYIALPLIWNKLNRRILGNKNSVIHT